MPTTPTVARDEMFEMLLDAMPTLNGLGFDVFDKWEGQESPTDIANADKTMAGKYWFRASHQIVSSRQSAMVSNEEPGQSPAEYLTIGLLTVQVFAPRNKLDSFNNGFLLATAIRDIYRNAETPSGVWFRRAVAKPQPSENSFWTWNVSVEFQYNELNERT